ncbi:MAG: heat shock protein transcriptional repressor HspR [Acidimicrobiia bacterium]
MSPERKKEDLALYVISVAAELAGVHPQTLRIYERKGLVEPQRTVGRSRRYSDRDIRRLQRIQELTNDGVSLAGVKRIIALEEELEDLRAEIGRLQGQLEAQREEADQAVAEVHRQYRRDLIPFSKAVIRFGPGRSK